jgi:hypothetical protein
MHKFDRIFKGVRQIKCNVLIAIGSCLGDHEDNFCIDLAQQINERVSVNTVPITRTTSTASGSTTFFFFSKYLAYQPPE